MSVPILLGSWHDEAGTHTPADAAALESMMASIHEADRRDEGRYARFEAFIHAKLAEPETQALIHAELSHEFRNRLLYGAPGAGRGYWTSRPRWVAAPRARFASVRAALWQAVKS